MYQLYQRAFRIYFKALTSGAAAIQLYPYRNITSPASWMQTDKARFDRRDDTVCHSVINIIVATE